MHRITTGKFFGYACIVVSIYFLFFSCQRELSPDLQTVSQGSLVKDSNGNCMPIIASGIYYINQNLSDSNYLQVNVNATSAGSYNIFTDTVNGFYFKTSGTFTGIGLMQIKLTAFGKPVIADTNHFSVQYNGSICDAIVITVDTSVHAATFTLGGNPNQCMNDTLIGSYIKNVLLDTNAKVEISIDVMSAGSFNLATNIVNGYSFAASGIFTKTGKQTIFLPASGTPQNEGTDIFSINTGTSLCNFSVPVLTAITASGNEYYPLSENSYWTYDDLVNIGDTIKETVVDSTNINNNLYKIVQEDVNFGGPYQYFDRKSGNDYFEYAAPNKYTTFFQYKKPVYADIPFLKENINTGSTWESPDYIDTSSDGTIISLKYDFSCLNANASVTVNGKAFANVYEIKMLPLVKQTTGYEYTNEVYLFYYAKGIGLIYLKKTSSSFTQKEMQLRNWHVN